MTKNLKKLYDQHPLSFSSILRRAAERVTRTEWDFAVDRETEITDQNHIGGAEQTIDLANCLNISKSDRVLDLACGLGGSARLLASVYRCRVLGIDNHAGRIADAEKLTSLAGLQAFARFRCADVFRPPFIQQKFTVLICQSAMAHFVNNVHALHCWWPFFADNMRFAIEDCYLRRVPRGSERQKIRKLGSAWNISFERLNTWTSNLAGVKLYSSAVTDFSAEFLSYYVKRQRLTRSGKIIVPRRELIAYKLACDLIDAGVLGYFRVIGRFSAKDE